MYILFVSVTRYEGILQGRSARVLSPDMRVIGRTRLSRATDESTSMERQREIIEAWADANNHQIVGWAEDLDVSGSVDPFATVGLGPWLAKDRLPEWDILCAWKLDRLARRAVPLHRLFGLCQDEGKTLVCVSDNIDLSTWVGRLIASVIAGVAEGELEAIRDRTKSSQKKLRELGRWGGGIVFYGFKPVESGGAGWEWERDDYSAGVLDEAIAKVLDGESTEKIAGELNLRGELAPSDYTRKRNGKPSLGKRWTTNTLRTILRSKSMLGYMTHKGAPVRDSEGYPILKGPELISQERFDRLQFALDERGFSVTNRSVGASPLLGVATCGLCGRLMHIRQNHSKPRGKTYRYYQCLGGKSGGSGIQDHEANIIKAEDLEELVESGFLYEYGAQNVREKVYIPAENHQIELDEAVRAHAELSTLLGTTTSTTLRSSLTGQLSAINSRVEALEKLPTRESGWEWQQRSETYAEAWETADTEARRQMLIKRGVTAKVAITDRVARLNPGVLSFSIEAP